MPRWVDNLLGILVVVLVIVGPVVYASRLQAERRNFRVVRDHVLYRSGQMSLNGLKRAVYEYGIRTVISLRDAAVAGSTPPDQAEEAFCQKEEIRFYRLPPRHWEGPSVDDPAPVDENVRKFREVMDEPKNYPVLIHCFAGIHRSGAYCAIYRMEYEHWTTQKALVELKACGYAHLYDEPDVLGYLERYRPTWMAPLPEEKKRDQSAKVKRQVRKSKQVTGN